MAFDGERGRGGGEGCDVACGAGEVPTSAGAVEAMGRGAEAEVGCAVPIAAVVDGLLSRERKVADFVLDEALTGEPLADLVVLAGDFIVGGEGESALLDVEFECGAGFEGESVGGDVGDGLEWEVEEVGRRG